ncbi:MAG TPA: hypothetical protein VJH95_06555 [Candidatus Nanoarchaeia archaeon]|nr:hypothetical protein [Candidatus Nanoarchaeia archaeon]
MVGSFKIMVEYLREFGFFDIILPMLLLGIPLGILLYRFSKYKILNNLIKPVNVLNILVAVHLAIGGTFLFLLIFSGITSILLGIILGILGINEKFGIVNNIVTLVLFLLLVYLLFKIDFKK